VPADKENQFIIESLEQRQMMNGAPGVILTPDGIEQPEAVIEAPLLVTETASAVETTTYDSDFLTKASIRQLANTEFVRTPETGLYVAEDSGEIVKSVNRDLIINPQKNLEIQQSAPLSAADIQALLSIDPDNLGGKGETKV
jgi:hypothetical protein